MAVQEILFVNRLSAKGMKGAKLTYPWLAKMQKKVPYDMYHIYLIVNYFIPIPKES